jgi:hypothetical protein
LPLKFWRIICQLLPPNFHQCSLQLSVRNKHSISYFLTLFEVTDVCPLLIKEYIQVGLQIQYTFFTIFRWSLSTYMVRLRVWVIWPMGSSINQQSM